MGALLEDRVGGTEHKAPQEPGGRHFDERRIHNNWRPCGCGQDGSSGSSGESAGMDRSQGKTSSLHSTVLNSYYLNEKCLQMNLESHQPVRKLGAGAQGEEKTVMMEKNPMAGWPRAGYTVEHLKTQMTDREAGRSPGALISCKSQGREADGTVGLNRCWNQQTHVY